MTTTIAEVTPRQAAKLAGAGYLVLFVLGIFANFIVREGLIESGDAAATAANIADSEGLFRFGLVSFLIIFVLDVAIAWLLYVLFRTENRDISLVAAWFRLVYTGFLGVALIFFFLVLQLLSGAEYLAVIGSDQIDAQVLLYLEAFNYTWLIGLVAFGIHLVLLGYLILKSRFMPRSLGILLVVAGLAYVIDTIGISTIADYDDYETVFLVIVAVPAVIAELALTYWLLFKAGKAQPALEQSKVVAVELDSPN